MHGMLAADPDAIEDAAGQLAAAGRLTAETFAREELACAAATTGDRDACRRGPGRCPGRIPAARRRHRPGPGAGPDPRAGPAPQLPGTAPGRRPRLGALTATETRIATLVRDGLTNREIGTRLFVSPRTVQTHVSHILQKTGLRSRVEIARFAGAQIRQLADASPACPAVASQA